MSFSKIPFTKLALMDIGIQLEIRFKVRGVGFELQRFGLV